VAADRLENRTKGPRVISEQNLPDEEIEMRARMKGLDLLDAVDEHNWDYALELSRTIAAIISNGRVRIKS
jgi:hypothetical protein